MFDRLPREHQNYNPNNLNGPVKDHSKNVAGKSEPPSYPERENARGAYDPATGKYTVKEGDYLSTIALRFNTTVPAILALNYSITDPNQIIGGSQLQVRRPAHSPETKKADNTDTHNKAEQTEKSTPEAAKKTKELTAEKVIEKAGEAMEKHGEQIIKKNIETGKAVDNFGMERNVRPYKNAEVKKMAGLDPNVNVGGMTKRGAYTTAGESKYLTKEAKLFKSVGADLGELAGPLVDAVLFIRVVQGKESPFVILNPISFAAEEQFEETDHMILMVSIKAGYESTLNLIANSKTYSDYRMINVNAEEFKNIMNGVVTKYSQLPEVNRTSGMGFAILVKVAPSDSFTVIAGFNIPGKQ